MKKRILSIVLVLALLVQILPTYVFAENDASDTPPVEAVEMETGESGKVVLGEMTDRRGESEKHFRMDDGSFVAVDYGAPVHYSTDDGETWNDIDNTLVLTRGDAELYVAENGDSVRGFAPDLASGLLFSVADGNYGLHMGLASDADNSGAGPRGTSSAAEISYPDAKDRGSEELSFAEQITPEKLRADVLYRDVYDGVDLSYTLYSFNVKETILVKERLDSYSFPFTLDAEGLTPVLLDEGSIELRNEVGEAVYQIPAPYMADADGAESAAVSYALNETASGSWTLTVTADADWIDDENRTFPVAIDPTVIDKVSTTGDQIAVTTVQEGTPNTSHYHWQQVEVGYDYDITKESRIYIGVDTLPTVPNGCEVVSAAFYLAQKKHDYVTVNEITAELHAVTETRPNVDSTHYPTNYSWIYSRTWNLQPAISPIVLDYKVLSTQTVGHYCEWDMTGLAREWYHAIQNRQEGEPFPTCAACIQVTDPSIYGYNRYANARFYGYGNNAGPLFVVNYRDMTGIEPYYSYQALGADRAGAAYISDYTGALTTVTPLVSYASTVNPFSLNLVYNSSYFDGEDPDNVVVPLNLGYGMRMGSGMTLDLLQKVEYVDLQYEIESSGTKRYIKYTDGDGTAHYFATDADKQANESGSTTYYYDEDGLGLKITEYDTNYFRMEDDKGNKSYFVHGYFTYTEDANGNKIQIRFSDSNGNYTSPGYPCGSGYKPHHIEQINNGQNAITVASFQYDSSQPKLLRSVTDASGTVYKFLYSSNRLSAVQRKLVDEDDFHPYVKFEYEGFRMTTIKDRINQYSINMSYTEGRVTSYWEQSGSEIGAGATITRVPGEKTTYTDWGNDRTYGNADDISTTYLFDYAGRSVNAFSTDANGTILGASNAVYAGTGNTDKKNNRTLRSAGIGKSAMPLLRNGGFERTDCNWTLTVPAGNAASIIATNEIMRTGSKALKLWFGSGVTGVFEASRPTEQLKANKTYSASVYVNTSAAKFRNSYPGVYLAVTNGVNTFTGDNLKYVTDNSIENGWTRISVSFTPPTTGTYTAKICVEGLKGILYFDDFQLEEGSAPANVNLLQNGGVTYWGDTWLNESNGTAGFADYISSQGNGHYDFSLRILGSPTEDKSIHQTVSLNQPGTQTYVLSGWAKANAVPDNQNPEKQENETEEQYRERVAMDTNKQFGLRAILTYSDNTTEYHYVPFNADVTDWQFTSMSIVPKQPAKTVSTVKVVCAYEKNANTAYFDNLSLVKEVAQTMRYDEDGNLVSVQSTGNKEETSTYSNGNLTQVKTGGSGTFNLLYNDTTHSHRLTGMNNGTDSDAIKEEYEYDSAGNVTASHLSKNEANPSAAQTINGSRNYTNSQNLLASVTNSNGDLTRYSYATNLSKMLGAATKITDSRETATLTGYLADGRVDYSRINSYININRSYDSKNQLTALDRGGYNKTGNDPTAYHQYYNFTYDAFGNTTGISVGDTSTYNLGSYTYAPQDGLLTQMTYGNGAMVSYTYDNFGRKTQTATSSGDSYVYTYTGDGQLYEVKDISGNLLYRYTYDTLGRLIGSSMKSDSTAALQTQHQYDNANRLIRQIWSFPGSKTYREGYEYDANHGRLTKKSISYLADTSEDIVLSYDSLSRIHMISTPAAEYEYDYHAASSGTGTTGLVSSLTVTSTQTSPDAIDPFYFCYSYDELGNITQEQSTLQIGVPLENRTYTYDNQSQLTQATSTIYGTWTYQYDTYGNIRNKTHGTDNISYTYGDANWLDLLTAVSGTKNGNGFSGTYTYDGSGNPTSFYNVGDLSAWSMTWKNGRELASATNGTHTVSYDYDVNGLRTYKIVDGVRHDYVYASGQLLRETYTQSGTAYTMDFLYDQSGRPYMLYLTTQVGSDDPISTPYYYLLNLQGDVLYLVNASGEPVAHYEYDPYGAILIAAGSLAEVNPLRYRGYYYDTETGFYYLQSRYYDPSLGRFLNADSYASTGQGFLGFNMFAYCGNKPCSYFDLYGNVPTYSIDYQAGQATATIILAPGIRATVSVDFSACTDLLKNVSLNYYPATKEVEVQYSISDDKQESFSISVIQPPNKDDPYGLKLSLSNETNRAIAGMDVTGVYIGYERSVAIDSQREITITSTLHITYRNIRKGLKAVSKFTPTKTVAVGGGNYSTYTNTSGLGGGPNGGFFMQTGGKGWFFGVDMMR